MDARISKAFIYKNYTANFDFDMFNLLNTSTTLGKQYNVTSGNFNQILEIRIRASSGSACGSSSK